MTTPETRIVYYVAASLEGFIATEDDSLEWLFPLGNPSESSYPEFIADVGAIAMGSTTYEWIQRNAEKAQAEAGSSWPYVQPKWVFTKRKLKAVPGADIRFFSGDAATAHLEMRAASQGKPLLPRRILSPALRFTAIRQMGDRMVELRFEVRKPRA